MHPARDLALSLALFVCVSLLSFAPSRASADELLPEAAPRETEAPLPTFEVELAGHFGLLGAGNIMRLGVVLDRQAVLSLGAGASYTQQNVAGVSPTEWVSVSIPLELRVYLAPPTVGSLTGFVRPGMLYNLFASSFDGITVLQHGVGGRLALGAIYLFEPEIALSGELGPSFGYQQWENAANERWMLSFDAILGIVFRV